MNQRNFYDDHDRQVNGSTPNLLSLFFIFTMIISAWWNMSRRSLFGPFQLHAALFYDAIMPGLTCFHYAKGGQVL